MSTQITTLNTALELKGRKALDFFSKEENVKPLIELVKKEALSLVATVETKKGRDLIGSNALKISKSRKAITEAIELTIVDHQAKVKTAKTLSKMVTTELNQARSDVLQPRDEWQEKENKREADRVADIKTHISEILNLAQITGSETKEDLSCLIEAIENIDISKGFQEFSGEAAGAKSEATKLLNDKIVSLAQEETIAEQNKTAEIEARINTLKMTPTELFGQPSSVIQEKIDSINNFEVVEADFGNRVAEADQAKTLVVSQLKQMKEMVLQTEQAPQPKLGAVENQEIASEPTVFEPLTEVSHEPKFSIPVSTSKRMLSVSEAEFLDLQERSNWLQALEDGGLKNWSGYQAVLAKFNNQEAA